MLEKACGEEIKHILRDVVAKQSTLVTDDFDGYYGLKRINCVCPILVSIGQIYFLWEYMDLGDCISAVKNIADINELG